MSSVNTNTATTESLSNEYGRLCQQLSTAGIVGTTSNNFSILSTNQQRVDFALRLQIDYNIQPAAPSFVRKSEAASVQFRTDGNGKFKQKHLPLALMLYTKCIANAPKNSESLGIGYANRSAVLYEQKLYDECLADIRLAKNSNYPQNLVHKLTERTKKAVSGLKAQIKTDTVSEESIDLNKSNSSLQSDLDLPTILPTNVNLKVTCAANNVCIKYSVTNGRYVAAVKDIQIGDIIAIEKPFAKLVLSDVSEANLLHCHSCLRLCYSLQPCRGCTHALYCSKACRDDAWREYHKFECPIIDVLIALNLNKLYQLALRITIQARKEYNKVATYPKRHDVYESDRYEEIHKLIANTKNRTNADLFERAFNAAFLYKLVKNHTGFFSENKGSDAMFKEILLHHLQTGPCNFHEISEVYSNKDEGSNLVEIGAGAYSFLSLFNHSCNPNVVRHCYKSTIVVRAITKISRGQQLQDNYGYHHALASKESRLKALKNQYFFDCACEACTKNFPLYQDLPEKNFTIELPAEDMKALRSGIVTNEKLCDISRRLQVKISVLEKMKPCKNLSNMQECLKQCFALMANRRVL